MFGCAVPRVIVHKYRFPCRIRQASASKATNGSIFSRSFRVGTMIANAVVMPG
jgi:hypothetical protein